MRNNKNLHTVDKILCMKYFTLHKMRKIIWINSLEMKDIDSIITPELSLGGNAVARELRCEVSNRLINDEGEYIRGQKIRSQIDMSTITSKLLWVIGVTHAWCHSRLRLYMIGNKLSVALGTVEPHRWSIDPARTLSEAISLLSFIRKRCERAWESARNRARAHKFVIIHQELTLQSKHL